MNQRQCLPAGNDIGVVPVRRTATATDLAPNHPAAVRADAVSIGKADGGVSSLSAAPLRLSGERKITR